MKKWKKGKSPHSHSHAPGDTHRHDEDLAARLAPLEETAAFKKAAQGNGNHTAIKDTIRVDKTTVKMPENMLDDERSAASTFRLDPAVLVILLAMLAFTAFVTWQIMLMPEK